MEHRKHKRNTKNHVIIVTSDAADADVRQIRLKPWLLQTLIIVGCVVLGAVIGYFVNERAIRRFVNRKTDAQQVVIEELEGTIDQLETQKAQGQEENQALQGQILELQKEIENLNAQIAVLSETVNQKTESENELLERLASQSIPEEYPLTGSANIEESDSNISIFVASAGSTVVATASGTVTAINDEAEFGHNVWVDHGNGYVTVYRNQGDVLVKLGDAVAHGTTIFLIGSDNTRFGYQIMLDGEYIDPMEMLSISG